MAIGKAKDAVLMVMLAAAGAMVLAAQGQSNEVKFTGKVEVLPAGTLIGVWTVEARRVVVSQTTRIEQERGPVVVGSCVEVEGTRNADASIAAKEIKVRSGQGGCMAPGQDRDEVEFRGVVQSIASVSGIDRWAISGRVVNVMPATKIEPTGRRPGVGDCVDVKGELRSDGYVWAERIQGIGQGACQQPASSRDEPKLVGLVQTLPASGLVGNWRVSDQTVAVAATTRIEMDRGVIQVGSCVEVRGTLQAGVLSATRIETEKPEECTRTQSGRFEFAGVVEAMPAGGRAGDWRISGRTVTATATTVFDTDRGPFVLGACVEVQGTMTATGVIQAARMEVKSSSGACIFRNGVVNAGSFSSFAVSPAQIVSIFGMNLGPATELPLQVGSDGRVSNRLGNTRVLFDGVPAALLLASQGQINAVTPCAVAGKQNVTVQVESNGAWTNTLTVPVLPAVPSIFTLSNSGRGPGAILNFDPATNSYSTNGAGNRIPRGGVAVIYATGFGQTNPACVDGAVPNAMPLPMPLLPLTATIGGKTAVLQYAGAAPGLVHGVFQVNAVVPADVEPAPNVPVVITVGGRASQEGVTIAVR